MKRQIIILLLLSTVIFSGYSKTLPGLTAEQEASTILNLWRDGNYEQSRQYFSPDLKANLSAAKIAEVWVTFQSNFGPVQKFEGLTTSNFSGGKEVKINILYGKGRAVFDITITDEGQVVSVWIKPAQ